ncbi:unnamed protein product [marine sediment metagenome]|uniref:Uncharacterized protein n=1 Tax=marine sediment metagenome TaxID=412755 RepID=X1GW65_9ZZZZ
MTPENGFLTLSPEESKRLANYLSQLDPLPGVNSGRWWTLCHGSDYIQLKEYKIIADESPMGGILMDIIKGTASLRAVDSVY